MSTPNHDESTKARTTRPNSPPPNVRLSTPARRNLSAFDFRLSAPHSRRYAEHYHLAFAAAATPPLIAGLILYGLAALWVCLLSIASALIAAVGVRFVIQGHTPIPGPKAYWIHTALTGLLLGLTLPVTVPWVVPVIGSLSAVWLGKELLGGSGNSLWHPALIGRLVVALMFGTQIAPHAGPFLAKGHLLYGSCEHAVRAAADYRGFDLSPPKGNAQAWRMRPPMDVLAHHAYAPPPNTERETASGAPNADFETRISHSLLTSRFSLAVLRDRLPPWPDTVWGHVPGGIGATCLPALLLGGLFLIHRGYIGWQLPLGCVVTVGALASVWPIYIGRAPDQIAHQWLPLFYTEQGQPAGAAVVLFHLTAPGLWLACLLLATDPVTSPLTRRGHLWAGVMLGAVIIAFRCNPWMPAFSDGTYWAVLAMNTCVPFIDRLTRRRVFGTASRTAPQTHADRRLGNLSQTPVR
ncbi:MAG: RnfABCDGE type electron transport complex subunit D [Phycisphaerae bacterium]